MWLSAILTGLGVLAKALGCITAAEGLFAAAQQRKAGADAQTVKDLKASQNTLQNMAQAAASSPKTEIELETTLDKGEL